MSYSGASKLYSVVFFLFFDRDNKEGFDRSGSGRFSDKFGGRPERGER